MRKKYFYFYLFALCHYKNISFIFNILLGCLVFLKMRTLMICSLHLTLLDKILCLSTKIKCHKNFCLYCTWDEVLPLPWMFCLWLHLKYLFNLINTDFFIINITKKKNPLKSIRTSITWKKYLADTDTSWSSLSLCMNLWRQSQIHKIPRTMNSFKNNI